MEQSQVSEDNKVIINDTIALYRKALLPLFSNLPFNQNVTIAVVDGSVVDIWRLESEAFTYEQKELQLPRESLMPGWYCGPIVANLDEVVGLGKSSGHDNQLISGVSLNLYLKKQAAKLAANPMWPYSTVESYQAALLHEFGHIAYNTNHRSRFISSDYNQTLMKSALRLFQGNRLSHSPEIFVPKPALLSEIFAFCTEYQVSQSLLPEFKKRLDLYYAEKCEEWSAKERSRSPRYDYSSLDEMYTAAAVIGRVLIEQYPHDWPSVLVDEQFNFG
jgi:hypothetical protein